LYAIHGFVLSGGLVFFALISSNMQKYHRCEGEDINGMCLFNHEDVPKEDIDTI